MIANPDLMFNRLVDLLSNVIAVMLMGCLVAARVAWAVLRVQRVRAGAGCLTTAARLLRTTDAPLATIAGRVGYTSEFAFAAAFKRTHGTAPGRYRRLPT